jgi:hypothetical protein
VAKKPDKEIRKVSMVLCPEDDKGRVRRRLNARDQNDTRIYQVVVQVVDPKSEKAFTVAPAPAGDGAFAVYRPGEPLPAQGDCFLQLWELDNWGDDAKESPPEARAFWAEDLNDKGKRGKNRLVGAVGGVLVVNKKGEHQFVALEEGSLPAPKDDTDSQLQIRINKRAGPEGAMSSVVKKVALGSENEWRWELGVYASDQPRATEWEGKVFTYPICFVESLHNLLRKQMAEGGLSVACYVDLDGEGFYKANSGFAQEAKMLAPKFGFISVEDGVPVEGVCEVRTPRGWLDHLERVAEAVKTAFPDVCAKTVKPDGTSVVTPPKIYRVVIMTHGSQASGLQFYSPKSDDVWFRIRNLKDSTGQRWLDRIAKLLSPNCVVTLYACNTGGNFSYVHHKGWLKTRETEILEELKAENAEALKQELAAIPAKDPDRAGRCKEATKRHQNTLKAAVKSEKRYWPGGKPGQNGALVAYGGDPEIPARLRNTLGSGSFAETLRDQLLERKIAADVWSHADRGHMSRNSRLRLFAGDGDTYDLVRLVFAETNELKASPSSLSQKQITWWWGRGAIENGAPVEHANAVKMAALCPLASLQKGNHGFSLKEIVAAFRNWFAEAQKPSCESRHSRHFVVQLQHARTCREIGKTGRIVARRSTSFARQLSVGLQPSYSGARLAGSELTGPRRIQLTAVERGAPRCRNRPGSRSLQTRSRIRWS